MEKSDEWCRRAQKMERYRRRGWVDRHLPSSSQQRTTYRCQCDWFGCLYSALLSRCVSFHLRGFFHVLVDGLLRFDGWQRSTESMKCKCYKVHGPILTTCTQQTRLRIQNKSNFVLLSFTFHIHWIYIHGHCVYYLLLPLFQFAWHFSLFSYLFVCVHFLSSLCHSSSPAGLYYCQPSVGCDITIESNV